MVATSKDLATASDSTMLEKMWGKENIEAGFTAVPTALMEYQRELQLDAADFNILMQLIAHRWTADSVARPSKKKIAEAMNMDQSNVRKRIQKLEAHGLIKRVERRAPNKRSMPNVYDLSGLAAALTKLSQRKLDSKKRASPRIPGKPKLTLVK